MKENQDSIARNKKEEIFRDLAKNTKITVALFLLAFSIGLYISYNLNNGNQEIPEPLSYLISLIEFKASRLSLISGFTLVALSYTALLFNKKIRKIQFIPRFIGTKYLTRKTFKKIHLYGIKYLSLTLKFFASLIIILLVNSFQLTTDTLSKYDLQINQDYILHLFYTVIFMDIFLFIFKIFLGDIIYKESLIRK